MLFTQDNPCHKKSHETCQAIACEVPAEHTRHKSRVLQHKPRKASTSLAKRRQASQSLESAGVGHTARWLTHMSKPVRFTSMWTRTTTCCMSRMLTKSNLSYDVKVCKRLLKSPIPNQNIQDGYWGKPEVKIHTHMQPFKECLQF
jgi:hypothetical protein